MREHLQQRLAPQQVRFVRMLEMNAAEAEQAVEKELEDNPALMETELPSHPAKTQEGEPFTETAEQLQARDYASKDDIPYYRLHQPSNAYVRDTPRIAPDESDDLYSSLLRQLGELPLSEPVRRLAEYVVGNLDSNGYLQRTPAGMLSDIAISTGDEISPDVMTKAIEAVRSLDPAGVGAESLRQSLELQLLRREDSQTRRDALRIVREGWDEFLMQHAHRLRTLLRIPVDRVSRAMQEISSLNPKPGGSMAGGRLSGAAPVVPDFVVEPDGRGGLNISLGGRHPDLAIEQSFDSAVKMLQNSKNRRAVQGADYIQARWSDARDFISLVKQRRRTLMDVITAIASLQKEYFLTGDDSVLRPMTQKDVARLSGFDPSTVSRATSGKYVQTIAGVKGLRHFFSEGYAGADGEEEVSARQVQAAMRELIKGEDPRHPLSDEKLRLALSQQGLEVSRRTVAKYRDRLRLPVARLRKKH